MEELCRQEFVLIAMLAYLFGIAAELRYCITDDEDLIRRIINATKNLKVLPDTEDNGGWDEIDE